MTAAILLTACDVKDPIYDTAHPNHGQITLTTDWSRIGEGLTAPANYTVHVGDHTSTISGTVNMLDYLFTPGSCRIFVYNTPEHITVSGSVATVAATSGSVENMPGWLFTATQDAVIEKDTDHAFTAVMQQQVRQLTLMIEPTGGTVERIERIEGTLSGVAGSLDFYNGTHAAPSKVAITFEKITNGRYAGKWTATVRLLGTAGTQQQLDAKIYFTDDIPESVTLNSDLTTALASFNADKRTPLNLGGKIVETPTEANFKATITDWTVVNRDPVVAE